MAATMSCRERLHRAFHCEPTDRLPVRLWGVDPMFPRADETWKPLYELCERYDLDQLRGWSPVLEDDLPPTPTRSEERDGPRPHLREIATTIEAPAGPLTQLYDAPRDGSPGYVRKHFIETVEDAHRWLSLPVRRPRLNPESYFDLQRRSGDSAMLMVGIGEAMYAVEAQMGSETFGFWLMDERELLRELIDRAYADIEHVVKQCLAAGVGDCYGWVGPELCIPPLASPRDFREFCFDYDKRLIDLIHDAGKLVWVHCHGDMNPVLEDFIEMGVDCLNPIEPPPIGKLTLSEAKQRCAGRMCLDGGVQNGDFQLLEPPQMVRRVEEVIAEGKPGGGFILCPTSDPGTWPTLSDRIIENHIAFVETAMRLARYD
ncbi:MAG: hypothetical protein HPY69_02350 [Armatimonadetes bacterium]|nr:hypothetical protein [Armatimonadota bacterium]